MTSPRDYYEVLGVERSAGAEDIRRAYRSLARRYHPDVSEEPDAAQRFKEMSDAYDVLSDAEKRAAYDRFGPAGVGAAGVGAGRGPASWSTDGVDPSSISDLLDELFTRRGGPFGGPGGGGPGAAAPPAARGQDLQHEITITFLTAALGGTEEIRLTGPDGQPERIGLKIPPGIEPGAKLRVRNKGRRGVTAGPRGDLIVTVNVGNHPHFRRDGLDLMIDVPITLAEAALGTTATVPRLDQGHVEVKIPPGASSGRKLRIREQGIRDAGGQVGDLYVVVQIVAPTEVSPRAREILEELAGQLPSPREGGNW